MKLVRKSILVAGVISLALTGCSTPDSTVSEHEPTKSAEVSQNVATSSPTPSRISEPSPTITTDPTIKESNDSSNSGGSKGEALQALNKLKVDDTQLSQYERSAFGASWIDVDNNGCDTRNDILSSHMSNVKSTDGCTVNSGVLVDEYTLDTINFEKDRSGGGVDIDHVVALSAGWKTGMAEASQEDRESFANDPLNLLPVNAKYNRAKGDQDASTWIPSIQSNESINPAVDCPYVARQIAVKTKYHLWVTQAEKKSMSDVLSKCPEQSFPVHGWAKGKSKAGSSDSNSAQPTKSAVAKPSKSSSAKKSSGTDPDMGTCAKAKSAGYGPYTKGDPEYKFYQDRDGDGVVCE